MRYTRRARPAARQISAVGAAVASVAARVACAPPDAAATSGATSGAAASGATLGPAPASPPPEGPEGDVRLWVGAYGRVRPERAHAAASSGTPALDPAALAGSATLLFDPARRAGRPVAAALLFPVQFRLPARRPPSP